MGHACPRRPGSSCDPTQPQAVVQDHKDNNAPISLSKLRRFKPAGQFFSICALTWRRKGAAMAAETRDLPAARLETLATYRSDEHDLSPSRRFVDARPFHAGDGSVDNRAAAPSRRRPGHRGRHDLGAVVRDVRPCRRRFEQPG